MWIPIIGLLIGLLLGGLLPISIPIVNTQLNTILVMVSTDALFIGFLAKLEGRFSTLLFSIEFLLNMLLAIGMVYFGIIMGVDIFLALIIIFGVRIFYNLSQINHKLFIHH